ncbi:MAG: hypothetical protein EOP35_18840 [Rubrivivax sp.]|nr:MAG: hypothetical protein EOP35_18840 [Rubrivivax sp.]
MTRLAQAFWVVAALDAAALLAAYVMSLQSSAGRQDGGRAMGLFFFVLVPAAVLVLAALAFHFCASPVVRVPALLVVLVPGIWWVKVQVEDRWIDQRIAADRAGTGYFDTDDMRQLGAAVVQRDVATLMRLGPTVDINAVRRGMTLLALAVEQPDPRISDGSELPVVRALLALGAHADLAMPAAVMRFDPALLELLLAAGGHPNLQGGKGEPLIFEAMSVVTPHSFRLLAGHGLDLDSVAHGNPLPVQLAIYRRWDLLAMAIELGADTTRPRADGRNVAGELASQAEEEERAGRDVPVPLRHARELLATAARRR